MTHGTLTNSTKFDETPTASLSVKDHDLFPFTRPSYCDHCQLFIWGISKRGAYRCANCKLTVHSNCVSNIFSDCKWKFSNGSPIVKSVVPIFSFVDRTGRRSKLAKKETFKRAERTFSEQYTLPNTQPLSDLVAGNDGICHGQISIYINIRSVNFETVESNPSEDTLNDKLSLQTHIRSYLSLKSSLDSLKSNRITITAYSTTTTKEIIHRIMEKLKINSFSRKYCLVIKNFEGGNIYISRIKDDDFPLKALYERGPNPKYNFISFEENEFEEICWDNFKIPELENFLKILNTDEENQLSLVNDIYWEYAMGLLQVMKDKLTVGYISSV